MIQSKTVNLNGLKLDGEVPITPRTRAFCEQRGIIINQANGRLNITGNFSLSKQEVDAFLQSKEQTPSNQEQQNIVKSQDVPKRSFAGIKKGFLI